MAWGEIVRWNDRDFGFVRSDYPKTEDVFVYGTVLRRAGIKPIIGTCLEFETELHNGRMRVKCVRRLKTWKDPVETIDSDG